MTKRCSKCSETKDLSEFAKGGGKWCKECMNKYAKERLLDPTVGASIRKKRRDSINRLKAVAAAYVRSLKDKPCVECKQKFHFSAMDFDHLDPSSKEDSIQNLVNHGAKKERIDREVAKCELVCSNCHRVRTWNQEQQRKLDRETQN